MGKIDLSGLQEHEVIPGFRGRFIHTDKVTYAIGILMEVLKFPNTATRMNKSLT
jgi:hypothetical protein